MGNLLLAIDIGGTKLAIGLAQPEAFAASGQIELVHKEPIPQPGTPEVVIPYVVHRTRELLERMPGTVASMGISIGGPLDHLTGTVVNFPHLPGWRDIPLCAEFSRLLGVPAYLDNDANLGALAEHGFGAGRGARDMVYLTISTGIGGGVIIGGELLHGVASGAGEVGHITVATEGPRCSCGNHGCLEVMASGTAIARRAREALRSASSNGTILRDICDGDLERIRAEDVVEAMRAGDALARELWEETAEYLAIGLGSIIHVLSPEVIVLGGGVGRIGEELLEPVRRRLRDHVFYIPLEKIRVVTAGLGHDSALIGAMRLGMTEHRLIR